MPLELVQQVYLHLRTTDNMSMRTMATDITLLYNGGHTGDIEHIKSSLDGGADVDEQDSNGITALHNASCHSREHTIVDLLISAGADVNIQDKERSTALHASTFYGHEGIVKSLLDAHANVNIQDRHGVTPLHNAIRNECFDNVDDQYDNIIKLLIDKNSDVNIRNDTKHTPLHCASWRGNRKVLQLLIDSNADVNSTDIREWTALFHVTWKGRSSVDNELKESIDILMNANANINHQDVHGMTALHHASYEGHAKCVEFLLAANADASILDYSRWTPWQLAADDDVDAIFKHDAYLKHRSTILSLYHKIHMPLELALKIWSFV